MMRFCFFRGSPFIISRSDAHAKTDGIPRVGRSPGQSTRQVAGKGAREASRHLIMTLLAISAISASPAALAQDGPAQADRIQAGPALAGRDGGKAGSNLKPVDTGIFGTVFVPFCDEDAENSGAVSPRPGVAGSVAGADPVSLLEVTLNQDRSTPQARTPSGIAISGTNPDARPVAKPQKKDVTAHHTATPLAADSFFNSGGAVAGAVCGIN